VVIGPLLLLLMTQWRFLPYQDEVATWWHRAIIVVDVALLWVLWTPVILGRGQAAIPDLTAVALPAIATPFLFTLPFVALTFPGEWLDNRPGVAQFHGWAHWEVLIPFEGPSYWKVEARDADHYLWLRQWPEARRWVKGTLELAELDVVQGERLESIEKRSAGRKPWEGERTFRINGPRHLHFADLGSADLRRGDLRLSQLDYAYLRAVKLDGALLTRTSLLRSDLRFGQLQGASLDGAQLQGASLENAQLQGASLEYAQLQGAKLEYAQLQGGSLYEAKLHGASLRHAQLQGANLRQAQLQGATLEHAQLQGAVLYKTELQGALLDQADLRGASLNSAQLQGAWLTNTQLKGASLLDAYIYGSALPACEECAIESLVTGALVPSLLILFDEQGNAIQNVAIDDDTVTQWIEVAAMYAPEDQRNAIRKRLTLLKPLALNLEETEREASQWIEKNPSLDEESYQRHLAALLIELACGVDAIRDAPYVARGLVAHGRFEATGANKHEIASRMRKARVDPARPGMGDPSACPGVRGFTDADWGTLDIRTPPRPEPPKPPSAQQGPIRASDPARP
jgi:uncharacterized protein YjbI with pentapeptide repeats